MKKKKKKKVPKLRKENGRVAREREYSSISHPQRAKGGITMRFVVVNINETKVIS